MSAPVRAAGVSPDPTSRDQDVEALIAVGRGDPPPPEDWMAVHEIVARVAREQPSAIAVCSGGDEVSYGTLDAWAGRIARQLAAAGVRRGDHVAVLTEPSAAMVAAVLAVLRCAAAYVPVDRAQPDSRVAVVLADAGVTAVVVDSALAYRLAGSALPLVVAGAAPDIHDPAGGPHLTPSAPVVGSDAAYVIYTSGSTGEPKGVVVEHDQLAASTLARRTVYPGQPVFLLLSPLAFDSSVAGLWGTLTAGGRLVVATVDDLADPDRLIALVESHQVTRLLCIPSMYDALLDAADRLGIGRLRSVETVITAGEALPDALLARHFAVHGAGVALVNEYGPTEATVWASYRWFTSPGPVSIGRPAPGVNLYVLDEDLRPVPRGATGELFVGGAGVSRGYLGKPEATRKAFLADPYAAVPDARMYRTGDLVRWNGDATLHFVGRRDNQVKIRGHRIELGAVEAALRSVPGVRDAVVAADPQGHVLTGHLLAPMGVEPRSVRDHLAGQLPAVMIPTRFAVLKCFPRTVNGKVDRARLNALPPGGGSFAAPAGAGPAEGPTDGAIVRRVASAWSEVLDMPTVPLDVNFMDLGGHSLTMFKLRDALERHTGTRLSIVQLFRCTTVTAQADHIRGIGSTRHDGNGSTVVPRTRMARRRRDLAEETAE